MPSTQSASSTISSRPKGGGCLRLLIITLFTPLGAALAYFNMQSFDTARAWIDRLSRDGQMERFTADLYASTRLPLLGMGLALLAAGLAAWFFRGRAERLLAGVLAWSAARGRQIKQDWAGFWRAVFAPRLTAADWAFIAGLTLLAIFPRVFFVFRALSHDEAYTYVAFASRPWLAVISDYSLPNNHIFHSLLVKLSTEIFGPGLWAIRLPAFVSGVLCIPATYLLALRLYGRWTARLAAALVAALPVTILYSTNARGYSQFMLFTLLLFALAVYLKNQRNRVGWIFFSLIACAGFYTFPMMVYPFGGVMAWLFFSALTGDYGPAYGSRWGLVRYLVLCGVMVAVLSVLLYLPVVVLGTGLRSITNNPFVRRLTLDKFADSLLVGIDESAKEWRMKLPAWLWTLLLTGVGLSLVLHRWISRVRLPLLLGLLAWLVVILPVQRPYIVVRVWTFLIPLFAMWAAAGLVEPLVRLKISILKKIPLAGVLSLAGILYLALFTYSYTHEAYPAWQSSPDRIERTVRFLQPRLTYGDMIVISSSDAPVLWYYARLNGIPEVAYDRLEKHPADFQRAFVVVSQHEGQTLESAIADRDLDPARFELAQAQAVFDLDNIQVYECRLR